MRFKNLSIIIIILTYCFIALGCSKENEISENVVLTINDIDVSLEEAKYYAYNKQANYEVYYLTSGSEINWNDPYYEDKEVTLEQLVKTEVLEQIKKEVLVSEYAKDEGVTLTDEDKDSINDLVDEFITDSKDTLLKKTGKNKDIINVIFTRKMYCDKLYTQLEITDDAEAQKKLYKELIDEVQVELNGELWNTISFNEMVYTDGDVNPMSADD